MGSAEALGTPMKKVAPTTEAVRAEARERRMVSPD
jgi:hypothetical protein